MTKANNPRATGPRTAEGKKIASENSIKHGLFSKVLVFKNLDEEAEYKGLLESLFKSLRPTGRLEEILVEEIAICSWRLRIPMQWAEREIRNREGRSINRTIQHFIGKSDVLEMPLPGIGNASLGAGHVDDGGGFGWECRELLLRVVNDEREQSASTGGGSDHDENNQRYAMELRVVDPMDTILRYETKVKRDLYRAIEQLNRLRQLELQSS